MTELKDEVIEESINVVLKKEDETSIKGSFTELGKIRKQFTAEQIKFIVETVAPGLNDQEVWLFLLKASVLKLNPLLGEIFAYSSTDQDGRRRLVTIAGRNGKRTKAMQTGKVEYIKTEPIYIKEIVMPATEHSPETKTKIKVEAWDGELWGATTVIKLKGRKELPPVTVKVSEYHSGRSVWKSKPETMIKKVAESQAIDASGVLGTIDLYDEAESFGGPNGTQSTQVPQIQGGGESADKGVLETLKVMGADMTRTYTKQEAAAEVARLALEKPGKKTAKA